MRYVIGIDGGGTGSTLKILDEKGIEVGSGVGGATNISAQPVREVRKILKSLILKSIKDAGLQMEDFAALCIGTAGAGREYQANILRSTIQDIGIKGNIIIKDDTHIALVAGTGKEEGIIVIAGTGSIAYGRTADGKSHRAGGWGHIVGDEGSAYYIGMRALNEALRSYDGRRDPTMLFSMLMEATKSSNVDQLIKYIYEGNFSKSKIAMLAKIVDEAYKKGDKTATDILRQGAYELFLLVDSVVKALDIKDMPATLVASGSVLLNNELVFNNFQTYIKGYYPKLKIIKLNKDPSYGAAYIALRSLHNI